MLNSSVFTALFCWEMDVLVSKKKKVKLLEEFAPELSALFAVTLETHLLFKYLCALTLLLCIHFDALLFFEEQGRQSRQQMPILLIVNIILRQDSAFWALFF